MITLSVDLDACPACEAPLVKLSVTQRKCNTCGFEATLRTEEDEREAEDIKRRYGRESALQQTNERPIGKAQTRW